VSCVSFLVYFISFLLFAFSQFFFLSFLFFFLSFFSFPFSFTFFCFLLHSRTLRSLSRQKGPKRGLRRAEDAGIARKSSTSQTEKVQRATTVHTLVNARKWSRDQSASVRITVTGQRWHNFGINSVGTMISVYALKGTRRLCRTMLLTIF